MEAIPSTPPQNQPRAGASFNGSVCKQDTSSTYICQLEARSFSYSHRCLHTGMVHNAGQVICQPTLEHDRQSSIPSTPTQCPRVGPCGTSLESSSLLPNSTTDVDQSTTSDSPISTDNIIGVSEHHSSTSHMGYTGRDGITTSFQSQLQTLSYHHGETSLQSPIIPPSANGYAGVTNAIETPIQVL